MGQSDLNRLLIERVQRLVYLEDVVIAMGDEILDDDVGLAGSLHGLVDEGLVVATLDGTRSVHCYDYGMDYRSAN